MYIYIYSVTSAIVGVFGTIDTRRREHIYIHVNQIYQMIVIIYIYNIIYIYIIIYIIYIYNYINISVYT